MTRHSRFRLFSRLSAYTCFHCHRWLPQGPGRMANAAMSGRPCYSSHGHHQAPDCCTLSLLIALLSTHLNASASPSRLSLDAAPGAIARAAPGAIRQATQPAPRPAPQPVIPKFVPLRRSTRWTSVQHAVDSLRFANTPSLCQPVVRVPRLFSRRLNAWLPWPLQNLATGGVSEACTSARVASRRAEE